MNAELAPGELMCPRCGAREEHPTRPHIIVIRGFKISDARGQWSQCLRCSGFYAQDLTETPANHNPKKGWFCT